MGVLCVTSPTYWRPGGVSDSCFWRGRRRGWAVGHGRVSGLGSDDAGQSSVVSCPLSVVSCQWSVVSGEGWSRRSAALGLTPAVGSHLRLAAARGLLAASKLNLVNISAMTKADDHTDVQRRGSHPGMLGDRLFACRRLDDELIDVAPELFARGAFFLGQLG